MSENTGSPAESPAGASAQEEPKRPTASDLGIPTVRVGEIELAYETFGSPDDPTIVLVMGLATQMIAWPDEFCRMLAAGGYQVVRFDNRDIGLSTHLDAAGPADLSPLFEGLPITEGVYTLGDMADDTAGLIEALGVDRAHVVGVSMGGMIAQEVAARHPDRVRTLTSIMSTPAPQIGAPTEEAAAALLSPPAANEEQAGKRAVAVYRVIGSPGYPLDEAALDERGRESFRRAKDAAGVTRQLAAIHVSGDRREGLRGITAPTLVVHGEDDPLVQPDGGVATADTIPGARLVTYPGMGHNLPEELWPSIVAEILGHVAGN
ncbi:MAG: alpha/beta hydrolase [Nocardioidaceae bacterium]